MLTSTPDKRNAGESYYTFLNYPISKTSEIWQYILLVPFLISNDWIQSEQ